MHITMMSLAVFLYCVMAVAAQDDAAPTVVDPTFTPTASLLPTVSPTTAPIPAPVPDRACYTDLQEIHDKVSLKDPFIVETYILCPNTVYTIGTVHGTENTSTGGSKTISTRANCIFQCGTDGKSSNNCIITGGTIQILHDGSSFQNEDKSNVVIKGITFEDASYSSAVLAAPGDITFINCIFRNHQNPGVVQMLFCASCSSLRKLNAIMATSGHEHKYNRQVKYYADVLSKQRTGDDSRSRDRLLEEGEGEKTQAVTFDGCLFENNYRGSENLTPYNSILDISTAGNHLTINNSIFRNNNFATPTLSDGSVITTVEGSTVTISNTCFTNNICAGKGVVVVDGSAEGFIADNVFGTIDDKLLCSFASISDEICVDFDSKTCTAVTAFGTDSSAPTEDGAKTAVSPSGSFSAHVGISFLLMIPGTLLLFLIGG